MKAYITKYALTKGILTWEVEQDPAHTQHPKLVTAGFYCAFGEGREWHRNLEDAIERAKTMRQRKIAALKKQIEQLETMPL